MSNTRRTWSGTIALLNKRTDDGRMLLMSVLEPHGDFPLPLMMAPARPYGQANHEAVGTLATLAHDGDTALATGELMVDLAEAVNPELTARLLAGESIGVGIDIYGVVIKELLSGNPDHQDMVAGQLGALTIHDTPAWPEARITLDPL